MLHNGLGWEVGDDDGAFGFLGLLVSRNDVQIRSADGFKDEPFQVTSVEIEVFIKGDTMER